MVWNEENAWGIQLYANTHHIDLRNAIAAGLSFVVCDIKNPYWAKDDGICAQLAAQKVPVVIGYYSFDPTKCYEAQPTHAYWSDPNNLEHDTAFDEHDPVWTEVKRLCSSKLMQGLIVEILTYKNDTGTQLVDTWIKNTFASEFQYFKNHLPAINSTIQPYRLKMFLPASTKEFVDKYSTNQETHNSELGGYFYGLKQMYSIAPRNSVAIKIPEDWSTFPLPYGKPDDAYSDGGSQFWFFASNLKSPHILSVSGVQVPFGAVLYKGSPDALYTLLNVTPQVPSGTPEEPGDIPNDTIAAGGVSKAEWKILLLKLAYKITEAIEQW